MSDGGAAKNTAVSVKVTLGKEIDKSVGGVLTALLKPGATELGNLLGDGLGILADIVKAKRERNAQLGLEQVRDKLESAAIDLKDVTPPKEEELFLLINGLSLSDDVNVRNMWSGLFAKAIEPGAGVTAERAYISVLQSLSPRDAKILDLIAHAMRLGVTIREKRQKYQNGPFKPLTAAKKAARDKAEADLLRESEEAIRSIRHLADEHGLSKLAGQNWSANLMRQGVVERVPGSSDMELRFRARSVDDLEKKVQTLAEIAREDRTEPNELISDYGATPHIFMHSGATTVFSVRLTSFGRQLVEACGLI